MRHLVPVMFVFLLIVGCAGIIPDNTELNQQATVTARELSDLRTRVEQVEIQLTTVSEFSVPSENEINTQELIAQLQTQLAVFENELQSIESVAPTESVEEIIALFSQVIEIQSRLDGLETQVGDTVSRLESLESTPPDSLSNAELLEMISQLQNQLSEIETQLAANTVVTVPENDEAEASLEESETPEPSPIEENPETCTTTFEDDFSSNQNLLLEDSTGGTVRLSMGRLTVTANNLNWIWVPIQNIQVCDEFYVEFEMQVIEGRNDGTNMGIGLGDSDGNVHRFMFVGDSDDDRVQFFENNSELLDTLYGNLFSLRSTHRVGLESLNGLYTLYLDGQAYDGDVIQPFGDIIGVVVEDTWPYTNPAPTVSFNSVIIRESRE